MIIKSDSPAVTIPEVTVTEYVLRRAARLHALMSWVAERVAPHKRIRAIEVIDQIPKTPSGKILRRVLVARERGGS